jgi:hypothetical protein
MSWGMYHDKSEQISGAAEAALRAGDKAHAIELYRQAAEWENRALNELDSTKIRTLAVTYVSAASLWYKAQEYKMAEQAAYRGLAVGNLPLFAIDQLKDIIQTIWNTQRLIESGVQFTEGSVIFSISGGQVVYGGAPLDLILTKVDQVSKIYYRVVEMRLKKPLRKRGYPEPIIRDQFRPWLFQAPPGSYQFAVRIEKPQQMPLFPDGMPEVTEIAETFLSIVKASVEDPTGVLMDIVPDNGYRDTFLKLTKNLIPTGKTFETLEIRPVDLPGTKPIMIRPVHREAISEAIRLNQPERTKDIKGQRHLRGILRGLQLDDDWIEIDLVPEGKTIRIHDTGDIVDDVIGPMVNQTVIVDVVEKKPGKYFFIDIQLED